MNNEYYKKTYLVISKNEKIYKFDKLHVPNG